MTLQEKSSGWTFKCKVHFSTGREGRKRLEEGEAPPPRPTVPFRTPRVSRLMALAIRFDELLRLGTVRDFAHLARLGHVTRARVTQIMNLLLLAPDIQEEILFLPRVLEGRDPISERRLRPLVAEVDWVNQRRMWKDARSSFRGEGSNDNPATG